MVRIMRPLGGIFVPLRLGRILLRGGELIQHHLPTTRGILHLPPNQTSPLCLRSLNYSVPRLVPFKLRRTVPKPTLMISKHRLIVFKHSSIVSVRLRWVYPLPSPISTTAWTRFGMHRNRTRKWHYVRSLLRMIRSSCSNKSDLKPPASATNSIRSPQKLTTSLHNDLPLLPLHRNIRPLRARLMMHLRKRMRPYRQVSTSWNRRLDRGWIGILPPGLLPRTSDFRG
jgi:hypothetical protein